jgi:acyl-CoA hydrolase
MENYVHVRPEHLNHHGNLFGGVLLMWVDECAWMTSTLDFPGCTMVTLSMDNIIFKHPVVSGAILRFLVKPVRKGKKSINYGVTVYVDEPGNPEEKEVFTTEITLVRVDDQGRSIALPAHGPLRSAPKGKLG